MFRTGRQALGRKRPKQRQPGVKRVPGLLQSPRRLRQPPPRLPFRCCSHQGRPHQIPDVRQARARKRQTCTRRAHLGDLSGVPRPPPPAQLPEPLQVQPLESAKAPGLLQVHLPTSVTAPISRCCFPITLCQQRWRLSARQFPQLPRQLLPQLPQQYPCRQRRRQVRPRPLQCWAHHLQGDAQKREGGLIQTDPLLPALTRSCAAAAKLLWRCRALFPRSANWPASLPCPA